jgi:manganese transport protein
MGTDTRDVALRIRPLEVRAIGVAVEHKPGDAELLSAALWIARQNRARVTLVHVVETPGTMVYGGGAGSLHSTEDERYLDGMARELEQFELHVETMLRFGSPVEQIVASAADGQFDLLVMGAHGHKGIQDLIHGSTTDEVRHAVGIPVLIVHTAGQERAQHR